MRRTGLLDNLKSILSIGNSTTQVNRNNMKSKISNDNSHNISNSSNIAMIGVNNGIQNYNNSSIVNNYILNVGNSNLEGRVVKLKDKIKEVQTFQFKHKYDDAINGYNELIMSHAGEQIDDVDLFEVLINILLCYINKNDQDSIKKIINRIDTLKYKDDKRFCYLKALHHFYIGADNQAYEIIKGIEYDGNYLQGFILQTVLQCILGFKEFDEMVNNIFDKLDGVKTSDNSNIVNAYISISNAARKLGRYEESIEYLKRVLEIDDDKRYEAQLAFLYFQDATKDSIEDNIIIPERVNYEVLVKSMKICENVIKHAEENKELNLYMRIFEIYGNIKFILGKGHEVQDELEKLSLVHKVNEEQEYIKRFEYILGISDDTDSSSISDMDKLNKHITELGYKKDFNGIISLIENDIWTKHKLNKRIHFILLDCYLRLEMLNEFAGHIQMIREFNISSIFIDQLEASYYEKKGQIDKAQSILVNLYENFQDPDVYLSMIKFYYRYQKYDKLESLMDEILTNKRYIIEIIGREIYSIYFDYLLSAGKPEKALYISENNDVSSLPNGQLELVKAHAYSQVRECYKAALSFEESYKLSKNPTSLFNAALEHRKCNNIKSLEKVLSELIDTSYDKKEAVYAMLSDLELLKGDLDKSYEYSKKALELVIDYPKSEIHGFYAYRSMRCGKEEGIKYLVEFNQEYPKINTWVKSIKALEEDSSGNEKLTQEIIDLLNVQKDNFENILRFYKNGVIGISNISKLRSQVFNEIIDWRNYYNLKIDIFSGVIQELDEEDKKISKDVVIDALGLFILADIDALNILNYFSNIYVTYDSIGYLQQMILYKEDRRVREVLKYLSENTFIRLVGAKIENEFISDREVNIFDEFIKESLSYARNNNLTYIYGDTIIKKLFNGLGIKLVSVVAIIGKVDPHNRYKYLVRLKKQKYDFINFNSEDLYKVVRDNNFQINDDVKCFFQYNKSHDLTSFIRVYLFFLYKIYRDYKGEFEKFYILYLQYMDSIYKKSTYYLFVGDSIIRKLNLNKLEQISCLLQSDYYMRGIYLQEISTLAIAFSLTMIDTKEKQIFINLLETNLKNIKLEEVLSFKRANSDEFKLQMEKNYISE